MVAGVSGGGAVGGTGAAASEVQLTEHWCVGKGGPMQQGKHILSWLLYIGTNCFF